MADRSRPSGNAFFDAPAGNSLMSRGYFDRRLDVRPGSTLGDEFWLPAFGGAMPQSPEEWRHHSLPDEAERSAARETLWSMLPPVQAYRGGQDIARGVAERDPGAALRGAGQVGLAALPFFGPTRATRAPASTPERGPWSPGYHDEWLASRPPPVPRHELNRHAPARQSQPDRRWGRVHTDSRDWFRDYMYPGVGHYPMTRDQWLTYMKWKAAEAGVMMGTGVGAQFAIDAWRDRQRPSDELPEDDLRRRANEYGSAGY